MELAIQVSDLVKVYGPMRAVDGISLTIPQGEIFGLVGPNGAGKTTAIECIEGLRKPDGGRVQVLGLDPWRDARTLRERVGVQLQAAALPDRIKVWEALDLFASFYRAPADWRPILERLGLAEKQNTAVGKLSGGQRQRLFIALALVNEPELVFLDELTTGLDPQARRAMWDLMREIRERGSTVFMTTHFMEEAERLCDRVAIMDHGAIVALDSPANLVRSLGEERRVVLGLKGELNLELLRTLPGVSRVERINGQVMVSGMGNRLVGRVVGALEANRVPFHDLRVDGATLEDVFLSLTGREIRD
jgi:ABC-2 type transport system ATP-binding protein